MSRLICERIDMSLDPLVFDPLDAFVYEFVLSDSMRYQLLCGFALKKYL